MRPLERIDAWFNTLLTTPVEQLNRWRRMLRYEVHVARLSARRLRMNHAAAVSAALSFRTIFALVPGLVLGLLGLQALGGEEQSRRGVRQALDAAGLSQIYYVTESPVGANPEGPPATIPASIESDPSPGGSAETVLSLADVIEDLVGKAREKATLERIGPAGVVLLIWAVVTLMSQIEHALNRIFGARQDRSLSRRVLLYWAVVTLGPVLLYIAVYVGASAAEVAARVTVLESLLHLLAWAGPVLTGIMLLAGLYTLMPNTKIAFRAALFGAAVAVPLWLGAKTLLSLYVSKAVAGGSFYGALGLLPLFLMWLNLSWLIFLFGAEIAHTSVNVERIMLAEQAQNRMLGPWDVLGAAIIVGSDHGAGRAPTPVARVSAGLALPDEAAARLMDVLEHAGIIHPAGADKERAWGLSRPAETVNIWQLMELAGSWQGESAMKRYFHPTLRSALERVEARCRDATVEMTLADVASPRCLIGAGNTSQPQPPPPTDPSPELI